MDRRKKTRIIILAIWVVLALVAGSLISVIIGPTSLKLWLACFLGGAAFAFIGATYSLCWVGFPIGWKIVTHDVDFEEQPLRLIGGVIVGLIVMCFSVPIAIYQIFS